jgi:hypothetical protein
MFGLFKNPYIEYLEQENKRLNDELTKIKRKEFFDKLFGDDVNRPLGGFSHASLPIEKVFKSLTHPQLGE